MKSAINSTQSNMKFILPLLSILLFLAIPLKAQENGEIQDSTEIKFFAGIQPMAYFEQIDEQTYVWELNLLPVQLEYAINERWGVRISTKAYMLFRPEYPKDISRLGIGIAAPYHVTKKISEEGHQGLYFSPYADLTQHLANEFTSTTFAFEMGYNFLFNSRYSINIGGQAGKMLQFDPRLSYTVITNHYSGIFSFGIWF